MPTMASRCFWFHKVTVVTLKDTRRAFQLALWDEERNRLISFRELKG
jgi:hypothetical protein